MFSPHKLARPIFLKRSRTQCFSSSLYDFQNSVPSSLGVSTYSKGYKRAAKMTPFWKCAKNGPWALWGTISRGFSVFLLSFWKNHNTFQRKSNSKTNLHYLYIFKMRTRYLGGIQVLRYGFLPRF